MKDPTPELLREIPLHRIDVAFNALTKLHDDHRALLDEEVPADLDKAFRDRYRAAPPRKLKRPARHRLDDDFFRQVAFAYRDAVVRGRNPGKTIAEDSGVPHSTVARWIAQAREKGFLPPPQRGKATA